VIIRELITRLGFDANNSGANSHESALNKVRNAAVAVTAAYTATVGAVAALANQYADTAREIENQSRLANASTLEFQRMAAGARSFGIEQDKLSDILKDTNDRVGDFVQTGGGPMADFFENIGPKVGVTAEHFRNLSGPQALQLYVESLEKANVNQQDMVFYMEAMASDSTALIPLLRNGGAAMQEMGDSAEASGAILSDTAIKAAADYRKSARVISNAVTGIKNTIAEGVLPIAAETVEAFAAWWEINREIVIQNLRRYLETFAKVLSTVGAGIGVIAAAINVVADRMGGWERIMRIVMAAAAGFIALKLGGVLWAIGAALVGAGAGARILRGALMLLSRLPILALMIGLGLAIEDLIVWINGGDSAIGRWLGSWEDFSAKSQRVINDVIEYIQPLIDAFNALSEIIWGALTLDGERIIQGFNNLGDSISIWAMQLGGDIANFLLDAFMPDISAIMAGMRELGSGMLDWAKDMGARIAEFLLPKFVTDALGIERPSSSDERLDRDAPLPPTGTNRQPDALALPPGRLPEPTTQSESTVSTPRQAADDLNRQLAGAFNTPTPERVRENVVNSNTNNRNVSINARIESTLQVPQGTPQEQQAALRTEVESTFSELFNREINRTLNDMPEVT